MFGTQNAYLFVITDASFKAYQIGSRKNIEPEIVRLRALLTQVPGTKRFKAELRELVSLSNDIYNLLLKNGLAEIPADVNNLIVVPDDVLAYLPFEISDTQT